MNWLNPGMLWALLLLGIPIIIHLFYFRRYKKVFFSDIRLLGELKKETNRFSRIRNLLALLMRMLAIAALVLAFAKPFLHLGEQRNKGGIVSIYVDNSLSMSAHSKDVALLDIAKKNAKEIIRSYSEQNKFQLITNEMKGVQQNLLDRESALGYVDQIELYNGDFKLSSIYSRQKELVDRAEGGSKLYWISDFQQSTTDVDLATSDSTAINAVVVQDAIERNVSIDSAWFTRPDHLKGQNSDLVVQLSNQSTQAANSVNLSMEYDGQTRPLGNFDLEGRQSVQDTIAVPIHSSGWKTITLKIKDYPVRFDDDLHLCFEVQASHDILVINHQDNPYMGKLFKGQQSIELEQIRPEFLNYSDFEKKELIVLEDLKRISSGLASELIKYVGAGGKLLLFPSADAPLKEVNALLKSLNASTLTAWQKGTFEVLNINYREEVFKGVFKNRNQRMTLPESKGRYGLLRSASPSQMSLLDYRDRKSYLMRSEFKQGQVFVSSVPLALQYNDLMRNGDVFVPLLYNMAVINNGSQEAYYTLGREKEFVYTIDDSNRETAYSISKGETSFIPSQRRLGKKIFMSIGSDLNESGVFQLKQGEETLDAQLALNYSRRESNLDCYNPSELESLFKGKINIIDAEQAVNLARVIEEKDSSSWLWKYLLILALVFLLVESIVLRLRA